MSGPSPLSRAPTAAAVLARGIDEGLHLGAQVYVSRGGQTHIDDAIGEAEPGIELTPNHLLPWKSAGKPITAAAILKCRDQGSLSLDQPVAEFVPAFAAHGKERVTVFHLLTHTALLEPTPALSEQTTWPDIIASICDAPLRTGWKVGEQAAYEPVRSWYILGEILQIVEQRSFADVVQQDWFAPLGMDDSVVAPSDVEKPDSQMAPLYVRGLQGLKPSPPPESDIPSPGSSLAGPIRELASFYEMLLNQGVASGHRLLSEESTALMTQRHREGLFDETFGHIVDFGLGVICNSNQHGPETVPYGFGRHSSPAAFGHGGAQSSVAFADPAHQLVVAAVCNGLPGEPRHQSRFREFLSGLYVDLGLE